ncbi:MAG: hypothetical protein GY778_25810 [bacterium]|nr:hypothetical protein [bacterium]
MDRNRFPRFERQFGGTMLVMALVHTMGVIVWIATFVGVLWRLYVRVHSDQPVNAEFVLLLLAGFVAGLVGGGLLLGIAALLRYLGGVVRMLDRAEQAQAQRDENGGEALNGSGATQTEDRSSASGTPRTATTARTTMTQVLGTLEELRDLMALPEEARSDAQQRAVALQRQRLCSRIDEALDARRVGEARRALAEALARFGPSTEFDRRRERLDAAARTTEPLAYARAVRQIEEAVADAAWSVADRIARGLATDYVESTRCRQLHETTRRARRYALIQECTTRQHWSEAVAAAEEFLQAYADSLEAQTLKVEINTLRENAEIQRRKHFETQIRQHVQAQRFADALRLARHVVASFPQSPQAQVLRKQIPALERRVSG